MNRAAYHILRVGLAMTFLWVGVLILRDPEGWGSLLQPWAANLLMQPLRTAMLETAALDFVIGFLLLVDLWTPIAGALAALHLVVVLVVTGIQEITVRDIGLLAASIAVMVNVYTKRE